MLRLDQNALSAPNTYFGYWAAFLIFLVVVRGLLVLCVLPGLEGWDEFQHLAYIDYLDRHGQAPVMLEARVDHTFLAAIAKYPQSRLGRSAGSQTYQEFWNGAPRRTCRRLAMPVQSFMRRSTRPGIIGWCCRYIRRWGAWRT